MYLSLSLYIYIYIYICIPDWFCDVQYVHRFIQCFVSSAKVRFVSPILFRSHPFLNLLYIPLSCLQCFLRPSHFIVFCNIFGQRHVGTCSCRVGGSSAHTTLHMSTHTCTQLFCILQKAYAHFMYSSTTYVSTRTKPLCFFSCTCSYLFRFKRNIER